MVSEEPRIRLAPGVQEAAELIHRNDPLIVSGEHNDSKIIGRIVMSNAQGAFAMTAVLFGLSFVGIFLFWFAEKFRPKPAPTIRP